MNTYTQAAGQPIALDDDELMAIIRQRRADADRGWTDYDLATTRETNNKLYTTKYAEEWKIDPRYESLSVDNRLFVSVRTILPFVAGRITQVEITPGEGKDLHVQFAEDFERILTKHAKDQLAKAKVKLAVQDLLRGQRIGILKWRYDSDMDDWILDHIDPGKVTLDSKARLHQEPKFVREEQERSLGDLVRQFPDREEDIYQLLGLTAAAIGPKDLETEHIVFENWVWLETRKGRQLVVCVELKDQVLGCVPDPNWNVNGVNVIDRPMVPYVFFNLINDGSSLIDQTSLIEQAQWSQKKYDRLNKTIDENARFGGTGVPIFAKSAIKQQDVSKVRFSPINRVMVDTDDVRKAFTVWQQPSLPSFIPEDKYDSRNAVDNMFGTPNVFRGEESNNNTLGQDVLIRDQAEGRQSEPIDCMDTAMQRFYELEAQGLCRYATDERYYKFKGDDGKIEKLAISSKKIAEFLGFTIDIKTGTNVPVDRAQRSKQAFELAKLNRISTLQLYKQIGLFENPDEAYKQFLQEQVDPQTLIAEVDKRVFDRDAQEDLLLVIGGKEPEEREDISEEYINYLTEFLLTNKYKQLDLGAQSRVSQFVDTTVSLAKDKMAKLSAMLPGAAAAAGGLPDPAQTGQPPMAPDAPPVPPAAPPMPPDMAPAPNPVMIGQ